MDHMRVLKRSWEIVWRYRALWIFGIILALTTGGSPLLRGNGDGGQARYEVNGDDLFGPDGGFRWPGGYAGDVKSASRGNTFYRIHRGFSKYVAYRW